MAQKLGLALRKLLIIKENNTIFAWNIKELYMGNANLRN
jgi:hypothetical protein